MRLIKTTLIVMASMLIICGASAQLGQSAGNLDFGEVYLNESKNLSYFLINSENSSLNFTINHPEEVNVIPQNGTIDGESQQKIVVTARPKEKGNFSGSLEAKVTLPRKGEDMVNLKVELKKDYSYEAIPKPTEESKEKLDTELILIGVILLIFGLLLYNNIKGGKRK